MGCDRSVGSNDTDGALVVVLPRDAEQIDPRFVSDPYGLKVSRLVFASLFTIDPRTLEVIPDLAESVKLETRTRYRVRLRKGLRFSDGSPLTSEDVLETYSGIVDPELRSRYAETYRRIKYVKVVDDRTIIFQLREPHATFLTDLEFPILRRQDARRPIGQLGAQAPIGAGPYRILERVPGRIELDANPHWHRGTPIHPRVRFVVMRDDNTRALRMLAGAGDIALGAVPPLLLPMFEEDPKFEVRSAPGIGTTYLGFNTRAAALRDLRVRRAIAHAIDRKALLEAKQDGRGKVTKTWIPSGHWAYTNDLAGYRYDPGRAATLLDRAGYDDPDGVGPEPRMRLSLRTTSDRARNSVARAVAGMLRSVGVEVDVRPSEAATLISDLNRGRFELTLLQVPEVIEPHVLSWFFASNRIPKEGQEGANRWRYRNRQIDAAFEFGRTHTDRLDRVDAYRHVQRLLARDLPVLPLWQPDVVAVIRKGVTYDVPRDGRFGTLAF